MVSFLALLVAVLGGVLAHWSHAGIEDGDHDGRAWAKTAGPVVGVGGLLVALLAFLASVR